MNKTPKDIALQILSQFPENVSLADAAKIAEHVRVNSESGCWEWLGDTSETGYGICHHRGRTTFAHRLVCFWFNPEADKKLTVDHLCRNRQCVNPNHLEPVTAQENTFRMHAFRRNIPRAAYGKDKTRCTRGHDLSEGNYRLMKGGYKRCKACESDRSKRRYRQNPEILRRAYEEWKARNPEAFRQYQKEYREKHKERYKEHQNKYEQKRDPEARRIRVNEWRRRNPEKIAEYRRRAAEKRKGRSIAPEEVSEENFSK